MGHRACAALVLSLVFAAGLAGCGQKGPLYLPGDEQAAEQYGPRDAQPQDAEPQDAEPQDAEPQDAERENADSQTSEE